MRSKVLEKIGFFRYKSKILATNMTIFLLEKNNSVFFSAKWKKNTADFTHSLLSPEDPAKSNFSREKKNTTPRLAIVYLVLMSSDLYSKCLVGRH